MLLSVWPTVLTMAQSGSVFSLALSFFPHLSVHYPFILSSPQTPWVFQNSFGILRIQRVMITWDQDYLIFCMRALSLDKQFLKELLAVPGRTLRYFSSHIAQVRGVTHNMIWNCVRVYYWSSESRPDFSSKLFFSSEVVLLYTIHFKYNVCLGTKNFNLRNRWEKRWDCFKQKRMARVRSWYANLPHDASWTRDLDYLQRQSLVFHELISKSSHFKVKTNSQSHGCLQQLHLFKQHTYMFS